MNKEGLNTKREREVYIMALEDIKDNVDRKLKSFKDWHKDRCEFEEETS